MWNTAGETTEPCARGSPGRVCARVPVPEGRSALNLHGYNSLGGDVVVEKLILSVGWGRVVPWWASGAFSVALFGSLSRLYFAATRGVCLSHQAPLVLPFKKTSFAILYRGMPSPQGAHGNSHRPARGTVL